MKKVLLSLVILGGLTLSLSGKFNFTWDNIARAQATAVPSCQFAGYNPQGSLVNTTIVCVSPVASGGAVVTVGATATACGAAVTPGPAGGAVIIEVPVCPTASSGPALPLSIANGGTGTAAPAPTGTNGCTVGTFPSLVVSCPTAGAVVLPSTSASPPIVVATPAGQVNVSCPTCLIANASSGGYAGVLYAAGVPSSVPNVLGQLDVATDTTWAGMREFSYVGQFTGLPHIVNRCELTNVASSGTPAIPCERATVVGDQLITMLAAFNACALDVSTAAGWTQLYADTAGDVCIYGSYQNVATSGSTVSPVTITGNTGQQILVVEVAGQTAPAPTPSFQDVSNVTNTAVESAASVPANSLMIAYGSCYGAGSAPQFNPTNQLGAFALAGLANNQPGANGNNNTQFWAFPFIAPNTVNGSTGYLARLCAAGALFELPPGSGTTNWWAPSGGF